MSTDRIYCMICQKSFHVITGGHLNRYHSMSTAEYKLKFPDAPLASEKKIMQNRAVANLSNKSKIRFYWATCEYCNVKFRYKNTYRAPRKYCTQECFQRNAKNIPILKEVKEKIVAAQELKVEHQKKVIEKIKSLENNIPIWLKNIYILLCDQYKNEKIEVLFNIGLSDKLDIAFVDKNIAISFYPYWSKYSKIEQNTANALGWFVCDVFTQDPKKAISIIEKNLGIVGSQGSFKSNDFRYVSEFYSTFSNSIRYR